MPDPLLETPSSQPQQIDVSNSDTIWLISSLHDAKLQKMFGAPWTKARLRLSEN